MPLQASQSVVSQVSHCTPPVPHALSDVPARQVPTLPGPAVQHPVGQLWAVQMHCPCPLQTVPAGQVLTHCPCPLQVWQLAALQVLTHCPCPLQVWQLAAPQVLMH